MSYTDTRPEVVCDTECLPNYWSIGFKSADGKKKVYELYDGCPLNRTAIASIFRQYRVFTFNGIKYDIPMICYAMSGASNEELKHASDELIQFGTPHWVFMQRLNLTVPEFFDHVDLMQVSPGAPQMPSLKMYAGRLHSRKMQEMPIHHEESVYEEGRQVIRAYHDNDLDVTLDLKHELREQVRLRAIMSDEYKIDLRSKSDAQVAEAVVKSELEKVLGRRVYPPDIEPRFFKYRPPAYIRFNTVAMRAALGVVTSAQFKIDSAGNLHAQDDVKKLNVTIGGVAYQMGIGGLHSQEANISRFSDDQFILKDRDVTSYYPEIILSQGLFPKHIGPGFLTVFGGLRLRRVKAKRAGDKNTSETLKIAINGIGGKFNNVYSTVFAPEMLIQMTLTGQLAVLMLIERLVEEGIQVVSANTDGIISRVPRDKLWLFQAIFFDWELETGYTTEETEYISVHSQSVNSYLAFYKDKTGKVKAKRKGAAFAASGPGLDGAAGLKKNPDMDICTDAVIDFITKGVPIEDTIKWTFDMRKFVSVRRVTGGAFQDGLPLGKALRWYYSTDPSDGFFNKDGNKVSKTIGAKLMMELQPYVPDDLDHDYYIREAYAVLEDIGMGNVDPALRGRSGFALARLPDTKNIHMINLQTGMAVCGKQRDSIRDAWVEYDAIPSGHKMCPHCKKEQM